MAHPSVHEDPATVNEENPRATLGALYYFAGEPGNSSAAPKGIYRYVQIVDLAVADGDSLCPSTAAGGDTLASQDRSADIVSTVCLGVAVGTVTADYHTYILCDGVHTNVLGDGSVTAGDALYPSSGTDGAADTRAETVAAAQFGTALEDDDSSNRFAALINCL